MILSPDTRAAPVMGPIIGESFPDLATPRPRLLFTGEEFDTWAAGDVVMKFPRGEDDARKLAVEVAAHPVIADRLGELVPKILGVAEPSDRFPFLSVAYIRARGDRDRRSKARSSSRRHGPEPPWPGNSPRR